MIQTLAVINLWATAQTPGNQRNILCDDFIEQAERSHGWFAAESIKTFGQQQISLRNLQESARISHHREIALMPCGMVPPPEIRLSQDHDNRVVVVAVRGSPFSGFSFAVAEACSGLEYLMWTSGNRGRRLTCR